MIKIIGGKTWTAVCVVLTILMITSALWIGLRYYISMDIYETPSMFLASRMASASISQARSTAAVSVEK